MTDLEARQQKILEEVILPSLPGRSAEQQQRDLLRLEMEEDLRKMKLEDVWNRRMV